MVGEVVPEEIEASGAHSSQADGLARLSNNAKRGEGVMTCSDNMHGSPTLTCPCCGYQVVSDSFEICKICGWEYDPYGQNINPDEGGGPNPMTLREAQRNYASFGAKGERYLDMVRAPTAGDRRHPQWKPL